MMTAEQLAQFFHESYERLAPWFGYKTREESAKPWADVPEQNRKLMTAVCAEVLTQAAAQLAEKAPTEYELLCVERYNTIQDLTRELAEKERESRNLKCAVKLLTERAEAAEQRLQEAQAEIELLKCLGRSTSPCGHFSRYAYTENGGKNIVCLWCELRQREAELEQRWIAVGEKEPPKDGSEVLLLVKYRAGIPNGKLVGHWQPGGHCIQDHPPIEAGWYFWNGRMFDQSSEPTHWQPLPSPPKVQP